jgi:hypothetical protein
MFSPPQLEEPPDEACDQKDRAQAACEDPVFSGVPAHGAKIVHFSSVYKPAKKAGLSGTLNTLDTNVGKMLTLNPVCVCMA